MRRLADQPVRAREERHEKQGADQDRHDVDGNLRVADAPDVHEAVGVLVREGASHERVRHPRDRDQQGAAQRRPGDAAARPRERGRPHEGGGDDDVLQRVSDEHEARKDLVGANQRRVTIAVTVIIISAHRFVARVGQMLGRTWRVRIPHVDTLEVRAASTYCSDSTRCSTATGRSTSGSASTSVRAPYLCVP